MCLDGSFDDLRPRSGLNLQPADFSGCVAVLILRQMEPWPFSTRET